MDGDKKSNVNRQSRNSEHDVKDLSDCQSNDRDFTFFENMMTLISTSENFRVEKPIKTLQIMSLEGHLGT